MSSKTRPHAGNRFRPSGRGSPFTVPAHRSVPSGMKLARFPCAGWRRVGNGSRCRASSTCVRRRGGSVSAGQCWSVPVSSRKCPPGGGGLPFSPFGRARRRWRLPENSRRSAGRNRHEGPPGGARAHLRTDSRSSDGQSRRPPLRARRDGHLDRERRRPRHRALRPEYREAAADRSSLPSRHFRTCPRPARNAPYAAIVDERPEWRQLSTAATLAQKSHGVDRPIASRPLAVRRHWIRPPRSHKELKGATSDRHHSVGDSTPGYCRGRCGSRTAAVKPSLGESPAAIFWG